MFSYKDTLSSSHVGGASHRIGSDAAHKSMEGYLLPAQLLQTERSNHRSQFKKISSRKPRTAIEGSGQMQDEIGLPVNQRNT